MDETLPFNVKIFRLVCYNLQNKPTTYDYIINTFKIYLIFKHSFGVEIPNARRLPKNYATG